MKISEKWLPRAARRLRKPMKDDWKKQPGRPVLLKCTYQGCSHEWVYTGRGSWVRCPFCSNYAKVALAKRMQQSRQG